MIRPTAPDWVRAPYLTPRLYADAAPETVAEATSPEHADEAERESA